MFDHYTLTARRVVFFAREQASKFGSRSIESHHLLLGLFQADLGLVLRVLEDQRAVEEIRNGFQAQFPAKSYIPVSVDLPLSDECKRILGRAHEEASLRRTGQTQPRITAGDLLLGLLGEKGSPAAQALLSRGASLIETREIVNAYPEAPDAPLPPEFPLTYNKPRPTLL